jgi:hypothetical protein
MGGGRGRIDLTGYFMPGQSTNYRHHHPDGAFFVTVHDGLGRPLSLSDPASVRHLTVYTPRGGPVWILRNNLTQTIYGYGPLYRLGSIAMDAIAVTDYGDSALIWEQPPSALRTRQSSRSVFRASPMHMMRSADSRASRAASANPATLATFT